MVGVEIPGKGTGVGVGAHDESKTAIAVQMMSNLKDIEVFMFSSLSFDVNQRQASA